MAFGFIALGLLSILYYGFLVCYTKRWNSTFSWFWITFAVANIGIGMIVGYMPQWMGYLLAGITICLWFAFFAVEVIILCAMVSVVPENLDYIIILGAQVRGKRVTESLKRRLDRGLRYLQENQETTVIVSGGQGRGEEISEAEAMADYLISAGIECEKIELEEESVSTYENLRNSLRFIENEKKDKIGIVTNNFHIYRSMKLAKQIGYKKVYAIPASSNAVMFLNYMVREFFAVIALFLKTQKNRKHV